MKLMNLATLLMVMSHDTEAIRIPEATRPTEAPGGSKGADKGSTPAQGMERHQTHATRTG